MECFRRVERKNTHDHPRRQRKKSLSPNSNWGYTKVNDQHCSEYQVDHPRWEIYPVRSYRIDVDFGKVYGEAFKCLESMKPSSIFLAEGSAISVLNSRKVIGALF
ncbi:MAG: DUF2071 domain-containing protein [Bacteroidota bacterium]